MDVVINTKSKKILNTTNDVEEIERKKSSEYTRSSIDAVVCMETDIRTFNDNNLSLCSGNNKNFFLCNGINDNEQISNAVKYLNSVGGGTIKILPGKYNMAAGVYLKSNIKIEMSKSTLLKMADQIICPLTTSLESGKNSCNISHKDIKKFKVGQEVGFTAGGLGYQSGQFASVITSIDNNTIYLRDASSITYPAGTSIIATLNSAFIALDSATEKLSDITISGGDIDGNKDNTKVWIKDLFQNGIITGGVENLKVLGVYVHDFPFQNIHISGSIVLNRTLGCRIEDCRAENSRSSGICIDSIFRDDNIMILNCVGKNNGNSGLQLVAVNSATVLGGIYNNNGFCGIRSAHDDIAMHDISIIGASVSSNNYGIGIRNGKNLTISNCTTRNNATYGIALEEDCSNNLISDCVMTSEAVAISENTTGTSNNIIMNPGFINCVNNMALSTASVLYATDCFKTNKAMMATRFIADAPNNHYQFSENGNIKWHLEVVGGNLWIVQSGVAERVKFSGDITEFLNSLKINGGFGCNGKDPQSSISVVNELNAALVSTDVDTAEKIATVINSSNTLINQIRNALINYGILE